MTDKQINRESNDVPDAKAAVAIVLSMKAQYNARVEDLKNTPLGKDVTTTDLEVLETKLVKLQKFMKLSSAQVERLERLHPDIEPMRELGRVLEDASAFFVQVERQVRQLEEMMRSIEAQRIEASPKNKNQLGSPQPPLNAKFLLYWFLEKKDREVGLGDAVEKYARHVKEFGKWRANLLFYQDIALSAWPFVRRLVAKAGRLLLLGEWLRKLIS